MASYREQLTEAVAKKFAADGWDAPIAAGMASQVASRITIDANGHNTIPVLPVIEAVAAENADLKAFAPKQAPVEPPAPDRRSALDREADAVRSAAAAQREARIAELRQHGNPWSPGTKNLTRQSILANLAPDLAARLKAEARA